MAVTLDMSIDGTVVADAAAGAYAARGGRVITPPLVDLVHSSLSEDITGVRTVVAVEDRTVELAIDDAPFEALVPAVSALAARGWDVVVLLAGHRNGEAHRALRGSPCMLQIWWLDEGSVCFGRPERP